MQGGRRASTKTARSSTRRSRPTTATSSSSRSLRTISWSEGRPARTSLPFDGGDDPLRRKGQVAHPHTQRVFDGVGDRRGSRALSGFTRAYGGKLRPVDQFDLDSRYLAELQNRIVLPA